MKKLDNPFIHKVVEGLNLWDDVEVEKVLA